MATHDDLMAVARAVIKECWACWGSYRPSEDEGDARRKDDVDPTAIVAPFAREAGERERDAARGRYVVENAAWHRRDGRTFLAIEVAPGANLSCVPLREDALDAVMTAPPTARSPAVYRSTTRSFSARRRGRTGRTG